MTYKLLFLVTLSLSVWVHAPSVQAQLSASVKSGAALGLVALELEQQLSGLGFVVAAGAFAQPPSLLLGVRFYLHLRLPPSLKPFAGVQLGLRGVGRPRTGRQVPFVGVSGGAQLVLGRVRLTGELGLGTSNLNYNFSPITNLGLFLGLAAGWRFDFSLF